MFRGEAVGLTAAAVDGELAVRFADQTVRIGSVYDDLRPKIERHLWELAKEELPLRVMALAAHHGFPVREVRVRNQKSRWGSCSRNGTVSLNWRVLQAPAFVRDYVILHELAHLRQMNHSNRFWAGVAEICPEYQEAERWLKTHGKRCHESWAVRELRVESGELESSGLDSYC